VAHIHGIGICVKNLAIVWKIDKIEVYQMGRLIEKMEEMLCRGKQGLMSLRIEPNILCLPVRVSWVLETGECFLKNQPVGGTSGFSYGDVCRWLKDFVTAHGFRVQRLWVHLKFEMLIHEL